MPLLKKDNDTTILLATLVKIRDWLTENANIIEIATNEVVRPWKQVDFLDEVIKQVKKES